MNFQQLRIVRETVRQRFNLTDAANALFTSQSSVSKHLKDLEDELGVELFLRKGKRLTGLSKPGEELMVLIDRMLLDASNIKLLAEQYNDRDTGQLTVATTHTQARYALPAVITAFKKAFPRVYLKLHQGSPDEIAQMLLSGEADIGIATEALATQSELATFAFYSWRHAVVVPVGHPLQSLEPITLDAIAQYPLVTYHAGFTGRSAIDRVFADAGLAPQIAMSALDADVIKTYVLLDLGVGILASIAYAAERDVGLCELDASHLFPMNTTAIAVRRGHHLRAFGYRFIELCSPDLTSAVVRAELALPRSDIIEP